jgi:nicotinamide riboside kinase
VFIYWDTLRARLNIKEWNGRHHDKIQEVFMNENLDYHLLLVGLNYVKTVCDELREDDGLREKFQGDPNRILRALEDYFGSRATKLSQETTT